MQESLQRGLKLYLYWTLWRKSQRATLHMKASRRAFIRGEETQSVSCTCNHALVSNHRAPLSFPQQCEEKRFTMPPILPTPPPPLKTNPFLNTGCRPHFLFTTLHRLQLAGACLLKKHNPHERLSFLVRNHSGGHGVRTGREDAISPLCLGGRRGRFMV